MTGLGAKNPKIQRLRRLSRRRSSRRDEGAFVIEGPTIVTEALTGATAVDEVFLDASARDAPWAAGVLAGAEAAGVAVRVVEPGVLARALDAATPPGVAAVAPLVARPVADVLTPVSGVVVVAAALADPGNLGTIVRSAEAFGARAVVTTDGAVDVHSPKVVRASAGSLLRLAVAAAGDALELVSTARTDGWSVVGLVVDDGAPYDEVDLTAPTMVVVGNEAHGLDTTVVGALDHRLTIPMVGPTESLNAAMAATVVLAEVARQRRVGARRARG